MSSRKERKSREITEPNIAKENINRLKVLGALITLLLAVLVGRLGYIQIIKGNDYYLRANSQWFKELPIGIKRGKIYDKNRVPLTDGNKTSSLIIFPEDFVDTDENLEIIQKVTGISMDDLKNDRLVNKNPVTLKINHLDREGMKGLQLMRGVFPVDCANRYDIDGLASHVIGYVNKIDNKGEKGLEKKYDELLKDNRSYKIGVMVDAQKRMIPGLGYQILNDSIKAQRKNVVTTIDFKIQQIIEEEFDKGYSKGSVVVQDVSNGDVLGMVSRPNYNQDHVVDYLDSNNKELYNRAIQVAYPPGSVFKIIVVAAALEEGIGIDEHFFCEGYERIGDTVIKCSTYERGGHGKIDLDEAFSLSCNSAFIQLGKKIGGEKILDMARKFGVGSLTGIELLEEIPGKLSTKDEVKGPGIGNVSIGQGTLEVTPLQMARITSIIANDGIDKGVRLVSEIVDDHGEIIEINKKNNPQRIISQETALKVRKMMEKVVAEGTGKRIKLEEIGGAAGKTGSAEVISFGKHNVHAWFTGYFPKEKPEYVLSVIIEDGGSGGRVAAPLFEKICRRINLERH